MTDNGIKRNHYLMLIFKINLYSSYLTPNGINLMNSIHMYFNTNKQA